MTTPSSNTIFSNIFKSKYVPAIMNPVIIRDAKQPIGEGNFRGDIINVS